MFKIAHILLAIFVILKFENVTNLENKKRLNYSPPSCMQMKLNWAGGRTPLSQISWAFSNPSSGTSCANAGGIIGATALIPITTATRAIAVIASVLFI